MILSKSDRLRLFSFEYSACYLEELLKFLKVDVNYTIPRKTKYKVHQPSSDAWRVVWEQCDSFSESRNIFVLVAGKGLRNLPWECKTTLMRVPWTLVLDFDEKGDEHSLLSRARQFIEKKRSFQHVLPGECAPSNFEGITHWLSVNGYDLISGHRYNSLADWRRNVLNSIAELAKNLGRATAPKPLTIVVLGSETETDRLSRAWEALDTQLADAHTIVISEAIEDKDSQAISGSAPACQKYAVKYEDFALGLAAMFGDEPCSQAVTIPIVLDRDTNKTERKVVSQTDYVRMTEAFELVHDGLVASDSGKEEECSDFIHGATISWRELDRGMDVPRDNYSNLLDMIRTAMTRSRTVALRLRHTPGAGGTTLARRAAWDLRSSYPVIILRSWSEVTSDRIALLAELTNLPIFAIVEGGIFPEGQRERLFLEARSRQIRLVTLEVLRATNAASSTATTFALSDPMPKKEAGRFRDRYRSLAPAARHSALQELASNDDYDDIRSPFFFGFYAFEDEFVRIPDFVRMHMESCTSEQKLLVAFLALVSSYSQQRMPMEVLWRIAGQSHGRHSRLRDLIGDGGKRLVVGGSSVGIAHPKIALEILKRHLRPSGARHSETMWKARLPDFCCEFIACIAERIPEDSHIAEELLSQIFVDRSSTRQADRSSTNKAASSSTRQGSSGYTAQFAPLINSMPSTQAGRRVLETLCESFPDNPHFWNHWGVLVTCEKKHPTLNQLTFSTKPLRGLPHEGKRMAYIGMASAWFIGWKFRLGSIRHARASGVQKTRLTVFAVLLKAQRHVFIGCVAATELMNTDM